MAKRAIRKPRAAACEHRRGIGVVGDRRRDTLAAIFASIRDRRGALDRSTSFPTDTGATAVLLSELDRLWQNPLPN